MVAKIVPLFVPLLKIQPHIYQAFQQLQLVGVEKQIQYIYSKIHAANSSNPLP